MELILAKASLAGYVAASLLSVLYLFSKQERWSFWMFRLMSAGLACHLASFGFRLASFWAFPENRFFVPVYSFYGALSYMAMAVAFVFFIVERAHHLGILGAFVLPWTVAGLGGAVILADPAAAPLAPALRSYWLNIHPVVIMTAYAAFSNAFGVGLALLIQERQIKSRKPTELCYRLPSLEELDNLNSRIIVWALPVLTGGIVMGGMWAHHAWGRFWNWDIKETWALITALIYGLHIYLRRYSGVRGRRSVYLSMVGFASVLFSFFVVNRLSELHGYLSGRG